MRAFKLIEREVGPGSREIKVEGELDLVVAERLEDALDRADHNAAEALSAG
jgi:hypothetical protein